MMHMYVDNYLEETSSYDGKYAGDIVLIFYEEYKTPSYQCSYPRNYTRIGSNDFVEDTESGDGGWHIEQPCYLDFDDSIIYQEGKQVYSDIFEAFYVVSLS